jgi:histidinol-phosphate aminotransferase
MTPDPKSATHWIRPQIQALSAYHVPDAAEFVKLDAMENPYGWSAQLVEQWLDRLRSVELNRYPDPSARDLSEMLKQAMQVPEDMRVLLGNGSDELIQMLILAVAAPNRVILSADPTFVMYRMIATVAGLHYQAVPLRADFSLDPDVTLSVIEKTQPAIVFLAYPNNPTGNLFDAAVVEEVIRAAPGLVVVDEAYAPFTEASFMPRLGEFSNLLVLRTVSKMGLAGLRLGLLAGAAEWLDEIDKTRLPYNINVLTQASALFALQHKSMLDEQARQIRADRAILAEALQAQNGIKVYPSEANFILFETPPGEANRVFSALREQGVLIKNLNAAGGRLRDCLRVTVGKPEENLAFMEALKNALNR